MMLVAIVLAASATAQAQMNVWERAIDRDKPERAAQDKYDSEMRQGDEFAMKANVRGAGLREIKQQIQNALTSYRAAAAAKPAEGEPYYRIGKLLFSMYFDCTDVMARSQASLLCDMTGRMFDRKRAEDVIAAWDAFEARSPLDPRLTVGAFGESEILFDRAILHTKLATKAHLEAAAADYEKILARNDGSADVSHQVLGNLAETYMMVGRMEDALEMYRDALRVGADTSTAYGYAVALDRDESSRHALDVIKSAGRDARDLFHLSVTRGNTFFVPDGEKYYYFALSDEAFGFDEEAIDNWRKYIASGAHPEFQPRAKAHLDALLAKKKRKALPIETPWSELLR
jgi:tetratricopeptide (TPR) repeat protein